MSHAELLTLESVCLTRLLEDEGSPEHPDIDGLDSHAIEAMLSRAINQGVDDLHAIVGEALTHYLAHERGQLFTTEDVHLLAESLSHALAAGDTLARSLVLDFAQREAAKHGAVPHRPSYLLHHLRTEEIPPMPPAEALHYFKGLVPELGSDTRRDHELRRKAFTLAHSTSVELTEKMQAAIADRLESGKVTDGPRAVKAILDDAGCTKSSPAYANLVWRTNALDSYNQATQDQITAMSGTFPVWRYANPHDNRSRPKHAALDGLYFPSSVLFTRVRGETLDDAANCRCTPIAVSKWAWRRLEAAGARLATMAA